jgi:hypothetical protein
VYHAIAKYNIPHLRDRKPHKLPPANVFLPIKIVVAYFSPLWSATCGFVELRNFVNL